MKKLSIVLVLIFALTCSLLAACGDETETSSTADSSAAASTAESNVESSEAAASSEVEDASSEVEDASSEAESSEVVDDSSEVDESSTAPVDGEPTGTNVAQGKKYTGGDPSASGGYTANLTDGEASDVAAYDGTWFGFWYNPDSATPSENVTDGIGSVVIDLGAATSDINFVRVMTNNHNASGIVAAKRITAYVSDDGKNFTKLGNLAIPEGNDPAWANLAVSGVSGRYVKIEVEVGGVWTFINEIEVYAGK